MFLSMIKNPRESTEVNSNLTFTMLTIITALVSVLVAVRDPLMVQVSESSDSEEVAQKSLLANVADFCKNPSWQKLSEQMDPENLVKERPLRLCPTNEDCVNHQVGWIQHLMGFSCLFFMLPSIFALYLVQTGRAKHCVIGSVALNVFLCYFSVFSFAADYWYTGNASAVCSSDIPEFKKQFLCNAIDLVNVPIIAAVCVSTGGVLFCFAPALNWVYPAMACVFAAGAGVQFWSLRFYKTFTDTAYTSGYDTTNPDAEAIMALKTAIWMHFLWHVFAVLPPLALVYGMMVYGLVLPF